MQGVDIYEAYNIFVYLSDEDYTYCAVDGDGYIYIYNLKPQIESATMEWIPINDSNSARIGQLIDPYHKALKWRELLINLTDTESLPGPENVLDLYEFSRLNKERADTAEKFSERNKWTGTDWGLALMGECREVLNEIKMGNEGKAENALQIGDELADVVTYCDLIAHFYGVSLADHLRDKFNAVSREIGSEIMI